MLSLTRRQIALVLACILTIALIAIGIRSLASAPSAESGRVQGPGQTAIASAAPGTTAVATSLPVTRLPHTSDPVVYARAVAAALFEWDTASGLLPVDYTAPVLADADPSGEEAPGLLTDVPTFVPTTDQWLALAEMDVAQSLSIETAVIPEAWTEALDQARGQIRPGTSAVTITGIRSRTGSWDGQHAQTMSEISFTVFLACPPAFARCRILRLSQLNNPLR